MKWCPPTLDNAKVKILKRSCLPHLLHGYQLPILSTVQRQPCYYSKLPHATVISHTIIHRWDSSKATTLFSQSYAVELSHIVALVIAWKIMVFTSFLASTSAPELINNSATSVLFFSAASYNGVSPSYNIRMRGITTSDHMNQCRII